MPFLFSLLVAFIVSFPTQAEVLTLNKGSAISYEFSPPAAGKPTFLLMPGVNRGIVLKDPAVAGLIQAGAGVITFNYSVQPLSIAELPARERADLEGVTLESLAAETLALAREIGRRHGIPLQRVIPVSLSYSGAVSPVLKDFPVVIDMVPLTSFGAFNPQLAAYYSSLKAAEFFNPIFGQRDRLGFKKSEILAKLAMTYGGRAAEEIIFGKEHITTGAGSDLRQATAWARRMVTEWGMSEKLGAIRYNDNQDEVFLGHSISRTQNVSGATAKMIDEEVREICETAEAKARQVLTDHLDELHLLAKALLEHETLGADEVQQAIRGEKIDRGDSATPVERERRSSVPTHRKTPRGSPGIGPEPEPAG